MDIEKEVKDAFLKGYDQGGQTTMDFFEKVIDDVIASDESKEMCSMRDAYRSVKFLIGEFKSKAIVREAK